MLACIQNGLIEWGKRILDITAGILCYELKKCFDLETNLSLEEDFLITGFQVWEEEKPEKGILYLCSQSIPDGKVWREALAVGLEGSFKADRKSPYILVSDSVRFFQLINCVQGIFQKYYKAFLDTENILSQNKSFGDILNFLEETYDIISMLADNNLKYIAVSEHYRDFNQCMRNEEIVPLEVADNLMSDENFCTAVHHNHAFPYLYSDGDLSRFSYCYNIRIEGEYRARFMIQKREGQPFYGGLSLAQILGKALVENVFVLYNIEQKQEIVAAEFYEMIRDLLNGIPKDSGQLERVLSSIRGWKKSHTYQVYLFELIKEDDAAVIWRYYQYKLEDLLGDCCVVIFGERLCCVRNLSNLSQDEWDVRQNLVTFLRENLYKAGISQTVQDIEKLHTCYIQAVNSLEIGLQSNSTSWYYNFEDMTLPYIWKQATLEMGAVNLYHPAIRTLLEYDRKEETNLTQTVFAFMQNRYNVTRTAQALYIHRTTLLFRLDRIEILTGLRWDSWKDRMHLAVTFELLNWCAKET